MAVTKSFFFRAGQSGSVSFDINPYARNSEDRDELGESHKEASCDGALG